MQLLFISDVGLGFKEEGVNGLGFFNSNFPFEIATRVKALVEKVSSHLVGGGDLYGFVIELTEVCSQGFISPLDDFFQGGL